MNTMLATTPELAVIRALESLGYRMGVDYEFQSKMMGGRDVKGGMIADFLIFSLKLIIRVQGEYYHYGRADVEARDKYQKEALTSQGYTVVDINAEDALRNARYYVEKALIGGLL